MTSYLLPPLSEKRAEPHLFPLLPQINAAARYELQGVAYPRFFHTPSGEKYPLFRGGIVSEAEIEQIAAGVAAAIGKRHAGGAILIVTLLQGALPFAMRVEQHLRRQGEAALEIDFAVIKVSSYTMGTQARQHRIVKPLSAAGGAIICDLKRYQALILLDDLVDSGNTISWLTKQYLPGFGTVPMEAYFMLEKEVQRSGVSDRVIAGITPVIGRKVPNEWVVGNGPDISFTIQRQKIHLFRGLLPGGIYAFNHRIEQELIKAFQKEPRFMSEQLQVYMSDE